MDDPSALRSDERAALAAWADEGDLADGFGDRVVAALLAERLGAEELDDELDDEGAVAPGPRPWAREGRLLRVVGLVAAIAAAAAVMLMVRVLPRASEGIAVADGRDWDHAKDQRALERSTPSSDVERLGARAAAVLAQHCSPCHDSTDPEGQPQALQIFDLEQSQWWLTMSDAQLEETGLRVRELGAATDDERDRVAVFVAAQLRQRAHAG